MVKATEKESYVLLGHPVVMVCGHGLDSNPRAAITWTNPQGEVVPANSDGYIMNNGPAVVQLNITRVEKSDKGKWMCKVEVTSECDSSVSSECSGNIYTKSLTVELVLVIVGKHNIILEDLATECHMFTLNMIVYHSSTKATYEPSDC